MDEFLKEPQMDCICFSQSETLGKQGCRGLNELYCAKRLRRCPFYKSKYEYDAAGRPLKGR